MSELVLYPVRVFLTLMFLYLVFWTGAVFYQDLRISNIVIQETRWAAIHPNGINPADGQRVIDRIHNRVKEIVPVTTFDHTGSYTTTTIPPKTLSLKLNLADGNLVTTQVIYGMPLPMPRLLKRVGIDPDTRKIPLKNGFSYWREWN